jgi:hypothetical protein
VTVGAFTVAPALGPVLGIIPKLKKRVQVWVACQNYVTSAPAIATTRPPARDEFLTPKRHTTVSTTAGCHVYFGFINKHSNSREIGRVADRVNWKSVERDVGWPGERVG